jgi:hypothetical protein
MSDGLQNALAESLHMNSRLLTLLETGTFRRRERSRSRRCCPRCGACKERSRPASPRRELRARLLPRGHGRQGAAEGYAKSRDAAKPSSAKNQTEDEYMRYVDRHFQELLDATQHDCQMRES